MQQFLRIANKGFADPDALTIIGVSSSRYSNKGLIGQFGTGSKYSIALLLRNDLAPTVYVGKLCMSFSTTPKVIDNLPQELVTVRYSGKDLEGSAVNRKERLGYTSSYGELDWNDLTMAPREFVSNAIDGAIRSGHNMDEVTVEVTDKMRAKAGWTQVFIPLAPEVLLFFQELPFRFLHFHPQHKANLEATMLPKVCPQDDRHVRIYKKGVLVATVDHEQGSQFDYNVGDELKLDESRNAQPWDVKTACARAWAKATREQKEALLVALSHNPMIWEGTLDPDFMDGSYYLSKEQQEESRREWKAAFEHVHGEDAVVVTSHFSADYVQRKGFKPVAADQQIKKIAERSGVKNEDSVLTGMERSGRVVCDATEEMHEAVEQWWKQIISVGLANGRHKPEVKGFQQPMDAESQTWALADTANGVVYFHVELAGNGLRKAAVEELAHHCTGATDCSRDFQDWILRLLTQLVFKDTTKSE